MTDLTGLKKRTGFNCKELEMLEEADEILENIRNAIYTVTGYIPPRRVYPEDMDPVMTNRRQTAIHEAGHAVVGRVLGLVCGKASIQPEGDYLGFSQVDDPRFSWERGDGPKRKLAENFCVALFAGAEAERVILGTHDVGDGVDCQRATDALAWAGVRGASFVGDDMFDRREAALRRRAEQLVWQHRASIERVADGLCLSGTLTGEAIEALIKK